MLEIQNLSVDSCPDCPQPFQANLRSIGRRLSRQPALNALAQQVQAVTEPAGSVQVHYTPGLRPHSRQYLSVLSANLWHDWPRFRRLEERLEDFARLVEQKQVDLLLLQEVAHTANQHAGTWLAERLGMAFAYARSNGHRSAIGFEEGLAILSRHPLDLPRLRQLSPSTNPFWRRMALGVQVITPWGKLLAFTAHLGIAPRQNVAQLEHLQAWIGEQSAGSPALIGGDFNTHETSPQILEARRHWWDTFRRIHPDADGATHTLRWPWGSVISRHRLDYVFLLPNHSSWRVLETRHLDAPGGPHSDHQAVLTRLEWAAG